MASDMQQPTRILIVDDHVILRDGLASFLQSQSDFEVVGGAGSIAEALDAVHKIKPDLVLMDYSLPDGTGLEACRAILAKYPETDVVFLTVHEDDDRLFAAIRSGAKGYLLKNIPAAKMLERLRGLERGDAPISRKMAARALQELARTVPSSSGSGVDGRLGLLTSRELEVLQQMVNGAANKEIAGILFISIHTVKNHVHNILRKLKVDDRRAAAELAKKHGLVRTKND